MKKHNNDSKNHIIFMIDVAKVVQNKQKFNDNSSYLSIISPHWFKMNLNNKYLFMTIGIILYNTKCLIYILYYNYIL